MNIITVFVICLLSFIFVLWINFTLAMVRYNIVIIKEALFGYDNDIMKYKKAYEQVITLNIPDEEISTIDEEKLHISIVNSKSGTLQIFFRIKKVVTEYVSDIISIQFEGITLYPIPEMDKVYFSTFRLKTICKFVIGLFALRNAVTSNSNVTVEELRDA